MPTSDIVIQGAREHNLQSVDVTLPRNQLICLTGVSGSGKSSLAFDTLYAEGQRRYVESLSTFARSFLGTMPKPDVDLVAGLSPSISISQKSAGTNPRSTVGTITEIYDYLRVLYARVGKGFCPHCGHPITAQTRDQIVESIMQMPAETPLVILAPKIRGQKGEHQDLFSSLLRQGFVRARVDGEIVSISAELRLARHQRHNIDVVVDRLAVRPEQRTRIAESVESALRMGEGNLVVAAGTAPSGSATATQRGPAAETETWTETICSTAYACPACMVGFDPPTPQMLSFNSPHGMCMNCLGLGHSWQFDPALVVPDHGLSIRQGAIAPFGAWKSLSRWYRHLLQGAAESIGAAADLQGDKLLDVPWVELPSAVQHKLLYGTGDEPITLTWRSGSAPMKYRNRWKGILGDLRDAYETDSARRPRERLAAYTADLICSTCQGERLNALARSIRLTSTSAASSATELNLSQLCQLSIAAARQFLDVLVLDDVGRQIAHEALKEIQARLGFLLNVGLEYLTLDRAAPTLSGGETQRIRLASQIGSGLVGVIYILDEPSIGLHPRDNARLIASLAQLRDQGNTVVVVEHDEETIRAADHIIDFGPGAGVRGGHVVAAGPLADITSSTTSVTGDYLSGRRSIELPPARRPVDAEKMLRVIGAAHNNLKGIDIDIPLGLLVCITGVSGSGKSSLVNDILVEALRRDLNCGDGHPGAHTQILGLEHLDKMISIDQSPIGRTPRSNPATYIKLFDEIRALFALLPESKRRGYQAGRFSFNTKVGRCQACEGNGSNRLEMDFLADVWVSCPVCNGQRFNRETLQVKFKDKSIADVLDMDVQQAIQFFENVPKIHGKLQTLHDVGLDYLKLGQPSPTLSGGEAQRIKLARELVKRSTGRTLYMLDEPTTGLHFADVRLLLNVLHNFVNSGNTVIVVEHNLDVIKTADWIIDLGPEGGAGGGRLVCAGTPAEVAAHAESYTGQALAKVLNTLPARAGDTRRPRKATVARQAQATPSAPATGDNDVLEVRGAAQHNLRGVDVRIPRERMTVFCGPSGSGKSSLAMDTIYAEGQRRYVESLSSYARQFVDQMPKPRVDHVHGLSPAIAIEQKNLGNTPRSTVGTVTEIYDYLRVLFARLGTPHCPSCDGEIGTQTSDQIVAKILDYAPGTRLHLLAPLAIDQYGGVDGIWDELRAAGFVRVRVNGKTYEVDRAPALSPRARHDVAAVIDRIVVDPKSRTRIADSVEGALSIGGGTMLVAEVNEAVAEAHWPLVRHSQHLACHHCGRSFEPLSPHHFSFNSPLGWCPDCNGLGEKFGVDPAGLVTDPRKTLADGAIELWPTATSPLARRILDAVAAGVGLTTTIPFDELDARQRKILFHGTGERWFDVKDDDGRVVMSVQFKGLFVGLEEVLRLSPQLRYGLALQRGQVECGTCGGSRLRDDAAAVRLFGTTIDGVQRVPLGKLMGTINSWRLDARQKTIAGDILREVRGRLQFLIDVGLDYLTLGRPATSLSNGEAQRIRLASQLGSGLCGVLYVLDEPTVGLHPRDNQRLLGALHKLRDLGNTLIVVEHDREVIAASDVVCDFGPAAGKDGGQIVAQGTPELLARHVGSVTGPYLTGQKAIPVPIDRRPCVDGESNGAAGPLERARRSLAKPRRGAEPARNDTGPRAFLEIVGARHHNLKNVTARIPLGALTVVTGPSGSGKSSLVNDVLHRALARRLHRALGQPGAHDRILGIDQLDKVIAVDQQPLGNTPSSNPATYCGVFELIRELFAKLPEARQRGFTARRFSFNVPGGRCEACEGIGQRRIEMHFLPDVWVTCPVCEGRRYDAETLAVLYNGKSIHDVLEMTCRDAARLFENIPKVRRILDTLCDVGLGYLGLGQAAPTLSGGEAQRVKLAAELGRPDTGRTLYLLDEPTTGLHFADLARLLDVLHRLVDLGNTVVLVEHNLDIIKSADWVIDLGPEAGEEGGSIVAEGTPEMVADYARDAVALHISSPAASRRRSTTKRPSVKRDPRAAIPPRSHTGEALAAILEAGPYARRRAPESPPSSAPRSPRQPKTRRDAGSKRLSAHTPWAKLGKYWHVQRLGFANRNRVEWDGAVLESLVELLTQVAPDSQFEWRDRQFVRLTLPDQEEPWATIHTKREDAVWLQLHVSQGATARQVTRLGLATKTARTKSGGTVVRMALQKLADVRNTRLARFLRDHLSSSPV